MLGRRNVTKDIWRAVVVAGAMLGAGACSGSQKDGAAEPTVVQPEGEGAGGETGAAGAEEPATGPVTADEAKAAPAVADAGLPDASPPDAAPPDAAPPPKKRPRGNGGKPSGRGFIIA
jgi:hypothetical protein